MLVSGSQKSAMTCRKRYQSPARIVAIDHHLSAEIEDRDCAESGNDEQNRKDAAVDVSLPQRDRVRLTVDLVELAVDLLFLAEVLRDRRYRASSPGSSC